MVTPDARDYADDEGLSLQVAEAELEGTSADPQLDFAAIYEEHKSLLLGIAVGRFGIPESDAEALTHEIFVDLILKADRVSPACARSWLVASIYNASRYYLRVRSRSETLPDNYNDHPDPHLSRVLEMWPNQLAARQAFACTTAKCQLALRLRYLEAYTIPEIAAELGTTSRYAAKLVGECLKQAQRRYTKLNRATRSRCDVE